MKALLSCTIAAALFACGAGALAQDAGDFPNKAIHLVTPFAPGATTDILSRIMGEKMSADWSQPVIIDNRPGATGLIGAEIVAKAPPDGYTLVNVISTHVIVRSLVKDAPIDPIKSFEPVILLARTPLALVVANDVPAKNAQEFVAYAKANSGKLGYGTSGIGSAVHLTMEQFKQRAGIDVQHVPYKGGAPALQDLLGGHVPVVMSGLYTATQAIKAMFCTAGTVVLLQPSGWDQTMKALKREFEGEIERRRIDRVASITDIAIIALVGEGIKGVPGVAARAFGVLGSATINILMIAQGSSELNLSLLSARRMPLAPFS